MRNTLPTVGPRPPLISRLYLRIMKVVTSVQVTPSGTSTVVTVGSRAAGSFTNSLSPMRSRPACSCAAAAAWRAQDASMPSSASMASASRSAYTVLIMDVWWYQRGLPSMPQLAPTRLASK